MYEVFYIVEGACYNYNIEASSSIHGGSNIHRLQILWTFSRSVIEIRVYRKLKLQKITNLNRKMMY